MTDPVEEYIKFLPDVYDKTVAPVPANNRKIFQAMDDVFADLIQTIEDIRQVKDLDVATGAQLDRIGESYNLPRFDKTDDEYRAFILAKIFSQIVGNGYDKILSYVRFFIPEPTPIRIMDLYSDEAALIFNGNRVPRAISLEVGAISAGLEKILYDGLQILKAAGIYANVNVKAFMLAQTYDVPAPVAIAPPATLPACSLNTAFVVKDVILAAGSLSTFGNSNVIYRSTDVGLTWSQITLPILVTPISWAADKNGVVLLSGLKYTANFVFEIVVLRSVNKGLTWTHQTIYNNPSSAEAELNHANGIFTLNQTAFPFGYYRSADAGVSWSFVGALGLGFRNMSIRCSQTPDSDMFYATTTALPSGATAGPVVKSEDGLTWEPLTLPIPVVGFPLIEYNLALFVLINGSGFYSTNQGRTWVPSNVNQVGPVRFRVTEIGGSVRSYAGNGFVESYDQKAKWSQSNDLNQTFSNSVSAAIPRLPHQIVGAVFLNGVVVMFGNTTKITTFSTGDPNVYLANYGGSYVGGTFQFTNGVMTTLTGTDYNIAEAAARAVVYSVK